MAELVPEPGVDAEADPVAEEEPEGDAVAVADADALAVGLVSQLALDDADGVAVADAEALTVQPTPLKIPTISTVEPSSTRRRARGGAAGGAASGARAEGTVWGCGAAPSPS